MTVQDSALNLAVTGVSSQVDQLSLHIDDGGTTGTNEISGGSYARKVPTYSPASAGVAALAENLVFLGPETAAQVSHLGFWADGGTTWLGSARLVEAKNFGPNDTLTVTASSIVVF